MTEIVAALIAALATSGGWWWARRKTTAEAEQVNVNTAREVVELVRTITKEELARCKEENNHLREQVGNHERRIARLETQIRKLGHNPVNGDT